MDNELRGNDNFSTGFFAGERVPSGLNPLFDGTVAQAYATLALAQEQRATTLAIIVSADHVDRHVASRAMAELTELLGWKKDV